MASSVEMASAPFGCVLRDHNRRDQCRETNARATMGVFHKNLKSLVRDHLCIAVSPNSAPNDANSENQNQNNADSCVRDKDENSNMNGEKEDGSGSVRHARVLDRWAFARQMVSKPIERQRSAEAEVLSNKDENTNVNSEREDGSGASQRHARVLDRWGFARQMVTKPIEKQGSAEAEVLSVPNSAPTSARTSTSGKEETIARTDSLADLTKKGVGASSLVQIWEKRLHKSDSLKSNSNGNAMSDTSRSSSGVSSTDNENENNASPPRLSEAEKAESPVEKAGDPVFPVEKAGDSDFHMDKARESIDESYDAGAVTEYSSEDSDGIAVDSRSLDAGEKEKVRVVDIIRRLTAQSPSSTLSDQDNSTDHDQQYGSTNSSPCRDLLRDRCSGVDQPEHKGLSHVLNSPHVGSSPRIRGRQAFADLLMQMERDRHKELDTLVNQKSVSRFPQRGRTRIQSLLRLRLLQPGMAFVGSDVPPLPPKPSRVNKPVQGSTIMHLREKFCTSLEQGSAVQCDSLNSYSPHKEILSVSVDKSSTSNKPSVSFPNREVKVMEKQKTTTVLHAAEVVCKEVTPSLDKSSTSSKPIASTPTEKQKTSTLLCASEDVSKEATPILDKSSTSIKPNANTPNREVKVMEKQKTSTVLHTSEDVCKEVTPSSDKSSTSRKPNESTCNREVKVMEQQKTSRVLSASEDVSEEATPSSDKFSISKKPSASTSNREVKVIEKLITSPVQRASEDVCNEATPSLEKSSTSNRPSESTCNREVKVMEQQKTSPVLRASEDVCAETTPSLEKSSTSNKPCESTPKREVNVMEQQKTSRVLPASENFSKEAAPSLKVTFQEPSSVSQSTSPHVNEDITELANASAKVTREETSLLARNLDSQETASPATPMNGPNETEIWKGNGFVDIDSKETASPATPMNGPNETEIWKGNGFVDIDSKETADATVSSNVHVGDELQKPTSSEGAYLDSQKSADTRTPLSGGDGNEMCEGRSSEDRNLDTQETADTTSSLNSWTENETTIEAGNFESQENADPTTSMVDWDENDDDYQYYGETNYDWISEISRPRSYWEDIRKSWYQEMLNSNSDKGEIRQLLERRTVSSFLSSDFRDKINRLMVSRVERQTCHDVSQEEEDDESSYDRMNQMVSFLQQRMSPSGTEEEEEAEEEVQEHVQVHEQNHEQKQVLEYEQVQEQNHVQEQVLEYLPVEEQEPEHHGQDDQEMTEEEEEDEEEEMVANDDDEEESRSLISGQFQEASDYFDRASLQPSPSHFTTWSYQDNEVGDDSDHATSASPRQQSPFQYSPQRSPSQTYNANHRERSPSLSHPSMEMELIYDMKGHMIQLYQEMSELRKAIKSCVNMQMAMQQSMKQDVHSGQVGKKRNSSGLTKGNCRICNEAKIDSLLYRCGHMCTCIKCAHDLQWNSGKCPICKAPIADVVRAYMDS